MQRGDDRKEPDMTAAKAVAKAARALDRLAPGWAQLVEPGLLSLSSGSNCVLGQMSESGFFHHELLRLAMTDRGFLKHRPAFGCASPQQKFSRRALEAAWKAELEARRVEAPGFVPDEWSGDSGGATPPGDRPALMGVKP